MRRSSRSIVCGVAIVLVVVAQQVQKSMDGEMGEVMVERLAFGGRLARDRLIGDDDVTDIWGGRGPVCPAARPETTAHWSARSCRAIRG